jgi:hypothetical protein
VPAARSLLPLTLLLGSCVRLGYGPPDRPSDATPHDTYRIDATAPDHGLDTLPADANADRQPDDTLLHDHAPWTDGTIDLSLDASPIGAVPLANDQSDPLNTGASGVLSWSACEATFVGEVAVSGLATGQVYQLKLEQTWSASDPSGRRLAGVGRTWDETVWTQGDTTDALPAPHTGVGPGDESASNIGDYLTTAEQDALFAAGHELVGYLIFAFFTVVDANTAELTEDDQNGSRTIASATDGFHIPFEADFSWHTSSTPQRGAIALPAGDYLVRFLITREWDGWHDPLVGEGIQFRVGACP